MNRSDRLVAMVLHLPGRRVGRAPALAEHFEVAEGTIDRDITALREAGVPSAREGSVGYSLINGFHLPLVMFTAEEGTAMFVGGLEWASRRKGGRVIPRSPAKIPDEKVK
jgi:predicted DNA-binding transcriptional regulator YafY